MTNMVILYTNICIINWANWIKCILSKQKCAEATTNPGFQNKVCSVKNIWKVSAKVLSEVIQRAILPTKMTIIVIYIIYGTIKYQLSFDGSLEYFTKIEMFSVKFSIRDLHLTLGSRDTRLKRWAKSQFSHFCLAI